MCLKKIAQFLSSIIISLALTSGALAVYANENAATANEIRNISNEMISKINQDSVSGTLNPIQVSLDAQEVSTFKIPVEDMPATRGLFDAYVPSFSYTDSLQTNDLDDLYFFSLNETKNIFARILSSNQNYVLLVAEVDWSTQQYTLLSTTAQLPGGLWSLSLDKGDYALYVRPLNWNGTVGSSYTIQANFTSPENKGLYHPRI